VIKQRLALKVEDNALAQACLERRLILVEDPGVEPSGGRRMAEGLGLNSYACAALHGPGEPFGVLVVDFAATDQTPAPARLRFLDLFARQATAALENARLLYRLEETHRELRDVQ